MTGREFPTYHGVMITPATSSAAIAVISIPVASPAQARTFYVDKLGFELVRDDNSLPGIHWVQVRPTGSPTSLSLVDWFDTMPAGSMRGLVFTVDDLDETYRTLTAEGVQFDNPPTRQPWALEATFRDPDGNQFVIQQAQ